MADELATFKLGDLVKKRRGSSWRGKVVGTYSATHTPEGYDVESLMEPGNVQVYPVAALEPWDGVTEDAAEIARLRAELATAREWTTGGTRWINEEEYDRVCKLLAESRGKAVADVAAWLRNWHYEGSLADDLETGKWERD